VPQSGSSALLKVQGTSKLAFGATTAALVTLASGGTAVLVSHVAHSVTSPTGLPAGALPPGTSTSAAGLVVERPAGSPTPSSQPVDPTERALHAALTARKQAPKRTLTAPLVPLTPDRPVVVPTTGPTPPPVSPPVTVPVTAPVTPPVTEPSSDPTEASRAKPGKGNPRKGHSDEGGSKGAQHAHGRHAAPPPPGKGRHAR